MSRHVLFGGRQFGKQQALDIIEGRTPSGTTGTCKECGQTVATFMFDAKAPSPWWYAVIHGDEDGDTACAGSGYPVIEQEKPT